MWIIDPNELDRQNWLELQDGALKVAVELDPEEGYEDNIKICFTEKSDPEFAFFTADEISFGITSEQARKIAQWLIAAADQNDQWLKQQP